MAQCSTLINFTNKPSLDVDRIFFLVEYIIKTIKTPTFINDIENIVKDASSHSRLKIVRQFPA